MNQPKFKIGDHFRWKDNPDYRGNITSIEEGRYIYYVYYKEVLQGQHIGTRFSDLESKVEELSPLEKALL